MLECYRIYSNAVLISCSRKRKNKYGLFHIFFTTVNNFGRVVVLGLALTNIKCKQGYEWMFQQFTERIQEAGNELPKVVITNADAEVMEAISTVFTTSMHLINQNFVLQTIRDVLFPFKKRIDFDLNMVNAKVEEAIVETDKVNFQKCEQEITELIYVLE